MASEKRSLELVSEMEETDSGPSDWPSDEFHRLNRNDFPDDGGGEDASSDCECWC